MGTLSLALTGIDPNNPIPGVSAEVRFAQGDSAGDLGPKKVLIMAPKTAAGAITADTQVFGPISDEQDAITQCGVGSPAHRMVKKFLSLCKSALVYVICPLAATGTAVVDKVTVTGPPTTAGVALITVCGVACSYAFTLSDTATTIGAGLATAINNQVNLPVTASAAVGVVTITGKVAGTELNSIRFSAACTASTGVTVTATTDIPLGTSGAAGAAIGAGTISYTNALATVLPSKYSYIVAHSQESAPLLAVVNQVNTQALPATGFRQKMVAGSSLTTAASVTLAGTLNAARCRLVNCNSSTEEHYVNAAICAATFVNNEVPKLSYNFDSYGGHATDVFPLKPPVLISAFPASTDFVSMLNNGVTPIGIADNGQPYIVRSVTTRSTSAGSFDYRVRDSSVVTVADKFTDDAAIKLAQSPWVKITDDPADSNQKQPPADFATPKRVRASMETLVRQYVDQGDLDPSKLSLIITSMQTGIDPVIASRMNVEIPLYAAILFHQSNLLVREASPSILSAASSA